MPPYHLPLELLNRGESGEVVEVTGDGRWVNRLHELGLRPGVRIQMLQSGSPCLFLLGGSRLSLRADANVQVVVRLAAVQPAYAAEVA